ncbi:Solanesyl diphosphate synthase 3, chloroplastic/mitochondrial [Vitis vinifera]|uniref:Solanesyl diphosphate synthase 3, chloroplastic/mitochondrial n=1 Tax=Vitis vinifera TaxID=29760 RepID=A0A438CIN6_VITVI|nr:Solanesyl diphosphate synthase 3, chloroplastic/mitochondrial [Vitis vinifera]
MYGRTVVMLPVTGSAMEPGRHHHAADSLEVRLPRAWAWGGKCFLQIVIVGSLATFASLDLVSKVASLLHDDVLDDAETRRGIGSLNIMMGNKVAVLAGDFLLSRACVALASLKNTEVVSLLATVVEHLVTGETMQMTSTSEQRVSMEYYLQKTYYKTASLISNSCKAIALLAGQTAEVSMLAFEIWQESGCKFLSFIFFLYMFGWGDTAVILLKKCTVDLFWQNDISTVPHDLACRLAFQLIDDVLDFTGTSASLGKGIITAPILFAIEEFPQLDAVVKRGLDNPADIDLALDYLGKSRGIQRTRELAMKHANLAAEAIDSLPESGDEDVLRSRRALIDLTHRVITRTK